MKAAACEWVDKAEADYAAALLLRRSRKKHSRDIVCFHLQQCVEKYLKARLTESAIPFPRTHDLERLLDLALAVEPRFAPPSLPSRTMLSRSDTPAGPPAPPRRGHSCAPRPKSAT